MKIAFIAGLGLPEMSRYGDIEMVLAQNVIEENKGYLKYLDSLPDDRYVIIDNGAHEECSISNEELIDRARRVRADEIVAPDVPYDSEVTWHKTNEFIDNLINTCTDKELDRIKVQAVPQGKTKGEWLHCYRQMQKLSYIDVIGLSRLSIPKCFPGYNLKESRKQCIKRIAGVGKKPFHLLGLTDPSEVAVYNTLSDTAGIRSVDTGVPYVYGLKRRKFGIGGTKPSNDSVRISMDLDMSGDPTGVTAIMHNMLVFRKVMNNV